MILLALALLFIQLPHYGGGYWREELTEKEKYERRIGDMIYRGDYKALAKLFVNQEHPLEELPLQRWKGRLFEDLVNLVDLLRVLDTIERKPPSADP